MAQKSYGELSELKTRAVPGSYRKLFNHYTNESLLISTLFYASTAMLFLGASICCYRLELVLTFPFVAGTMALYFRLAFKPGSAVQNPERPCREPLFMTSVLAAFFLWSCCYLFAYRNWRSCSC
jgi:hypothetical protein